MTAPAANPPAAGSTETPMQRDRATTIYERSVPGRRAAAPFRCDVPEVPIEDLIPERLLR